MAKNKILTIAATFAVVCIVIVTQRTTILSVVLQKGMERPFAANTLNELTDGLHLALCGAGGPMPAPKASGPCVVVVAGKELFIVDAGTDGPRNILRMGYQLGDIDAVFLTHFHSDHIDGLGELGTLRWAAGANTNPLPVYGPEGVSQVVNGFNQSYGSDFAYRHEHHGDAVAPESGAGLSPKEFVQPPLGKLSTLINDGQLRVDALRVNHYPVNPAVGYRFSYKGRSLLISGDTVKSKNIEQFAKDVDLLVHEALAPNLVGMMNTAAKNINNPILERITHDILDYHASPSDAAETARDANVGHLLYYHIVPPLIVPGQSQLFLDGAEKIFKSHTIGVDGMDFSMPAGSTEIIKTSNGL